MPFETAAWIWHNDYRGINVYVNFEDSFTLAGTPGSALLRISCDRNYMLSLNGRFVDCGQYSDYEDLKFYDELDVTRFLSPGVNRLKITVYYQGQSSSTYRRGEPGLIFELIADGEPVCVSSGSTIAYKNSAFADGEGIEKVSGQLGFSFRYDATRECEREGERAADIVEKTRALRIRPIEKLTISEPVAASLIRRGGFRDTSGKTDPPAKRMQESLLADDYQCGGQRLPSEGIRLSLDERRRSDCIGGAGGGGIFALIDLGAESTGFLSLDFEVPSECDVYIGWGEHLADLRVRTYIGSRCFAASYRAKAGRNRFENPLLRCGCRYIQLHIYSEKCTLYYAGIRSTLYPLTNIRRFTCADTLHNRIYETSVETLRLCMHEHYEDCPWREQALYSMDSRNQMLCGYYAFGETRFARASIKLMAHSLRADNMLELCSPAEVSITIPSFSAIFLTQLWEYLEHSGDDGFAREMLPVAEAIAGEFIKRLEGGLIRCFAERQYWNFYEWQSGLEGSISGEVPEEERSFDAPLGAFVSLGLGALSKLCGRLGLDDKAEYYRRGHDEMNRALNDAFFDAGRGCYASFLRRGELSHYCELTNALLVCCGAVPEERLSGVLDALTGGGLLEVTLSHSIFKYDALMREPEKYGRYVFSDIARLWGSMLGRGATSFWETIDGESAFGNAGSLCHGWSAIPAYVYFRYALGADPSLTGIYEARAE